MWTEREKLVIFVAIFATPTLISCILREEHRSDLFRGEFGLLNVHFVDDPAISLAHIPFSLHIPFILVLSGLHRTRCPPLPNPHTCFCLPARGLRISAAIKIPLSHPQTNSKLCPGQWGNEAVSRTLSIQFIQRESQAIWSWRRFFCVSIMRYALCALFGESNYEWSWDSANGICMKSRKRTS